MHNTLKPSKVDLIHVFVTGGGGAGKSHLIKAIQGVSKKR